MLVDTHAHLDQSELLPELPEILARAEAAGVESIISIGVNLVSSQAVVALAAANAPRVYAAVGVHPNYCGEALPDDWAQIETLARQPRVVGLGETGIDLYRDSAPLDVQQGYFERHLRLSRTSGLPFIVHMRAAEREILEMLERDHQHGPLNGVMHSFTGDLQLAQRCIELGMHISFAGMVTFKKSEELRAVAARVPSDRLLVETDSPYLSPQPLRGKRNEPAHIVHTARCVAEARDVSYEQLCQQTTENARRLFRLMPNA